MNEYIKHQRLKTRTYNIWKGIRVRCFNKNHHTYKNYGGRGVSVCSEWKSFEKFFNDMKECPIGYQIDRIDNNGNYCKENCRWVSRKTNCRNKRTSVLLTFNNKTKTITDWAEELQMSPDLISDRLRLLKWPVEKALTQPIRKIKGIHY